MQPRTRTLMQAITVLFLLLTAFFAGYTFKALTTSTNTSSVVDSFTVPPGTGIDHSDIDLTAFWEVWDSINAKYVTSEMPTDDDKVYGVISGLVDTLDDPYSVFFPPVQSQLFKEEVQGNFSGVGMEIGMRDNALTVIAPLKDTPASKAGIRSGDIIIAIDGSSTLDYLLNEAVTHIRGERGTAVTLTIVREGEKDVMDIDIVRDTINIPTIATTSREDGIFVIELYSFTAQSPDLFRGALREFIESGDQKLILDLRGNPGGYLDSAVDIASWFLPSGKVVARESYGENRDEKLYRSKGYDVFNDSLQFVILMDGGSASASEILSGALREYDKATLIGAQSFGKGSVQELINITPETSLKLTIARWLTPHGISISEQGLTPDIETAITIDEFRSGLDPQLDTAVAYLHAEDKQDFITKHNNEKDDESNP